MGFIWNFFQFLKAVGESLQSLFLLAVRLLWGTWFFLSGIGKWQGFDNVVEYFKELGIPNPDLNAYLATFTEMFGGFLLIIGLFSRLAALPLIVVMLVAYGTAHHDALVDIFNDPDNFVKQSPFTYLMAALIVFIFGPGKISVDYLIEKFWRK